MVFVFHGYFSRCESYSRHTQNKKRTTIATSHSLLFNLNILCILIFHTFGILRRAFASECANLSKQHTKSIWFNSLFAAAMLLRFLNRFLRKCAVIMLLLLFFHFLVTMTLSEGRALSHRTKLGC